MMKEKNVKYAYELPGGQVCTAGFLERRIPPRVFVYFSLLSSLFSLLLLSFSDDIHLNSIPPLAAAAVIRGVDRCCSARRPELRATMERRHYSSFGVFGTVTN